MQKLKYVIIMFITVLFVTGCGSSKDAKEFEEIIENMKNIKSSAVLMDMEISGPSGSGNVKIINQYDIEGNFYYAEITIENEVAYGYESYFMKQEDKMLVYTRLGENWVYEFTDIQKPAYKAENMESYYGNYKRLRKVKSDKEGLTKFELTIAKNKMNDLMGTLNEDLDLKLVKDFVFYVYTDGEHVVEMVMDFSDVIKPEDVGGFTNMVMTITISDINTVKIIEAPETAISKAIPREEFDSET